MNRSHSPDGVAYPAPIGIPRKGVLFLLSSSGTKASPDSGGINQPFYLATLWESGFGLRTVLRADICSGSSDVLTGQSLMAGSDSTGEEPGSFRNAFAGHCGPGFLTGWWPQGWLDLLCGLSGSQRERPRGPAGSLEDPSSEVARFHFRHTLLELRWPKARTTHQDSEWGAAQTPPPEGTVARPHRRRAYGMGCLGGSVA